MRSTSRNRIRIRTIAGAAAFALALAGCADEQADTVDAEVEDPTDPADESDPAGESEADTTDTSDEADTAEEPEAGVVATDTVEVRNINFEPADIEVALGTTVTWVNEDVVNHTVTSGPAGDPDGMFDEPLSSGGDDATITFDEAGTFDYYCDLHRNMVGSVTVTG